MNGGTGQFTGVVDSINVKGDGGGSAQLLFALRADNGDKKPLVVLSDSDPRTFAAMATVLTAAMQSGLTVQATYRSTRPTDRAIEIEIRRTW